MAEMRCWLKSPLVTAYCAAFEYAEPTAVIRPNDLSGYEQHLRHKIAPGCYTDDTQMSLAVAEALNRVRGRGYAIAVY